MKCLALETGIRSAFAAQLSAHGLPEMIPDAELGVLETPALVHISEGGTFVGEMARQAWLTNPETGLAEDFIGGLVSQAPVYRDYLHRAWSAQALTALLIRKLIRDAESYWGSSPEGAAICVSAMMNEAQRHDLRQACLVAGLKEVHLLESALLAANHLRGHLRAHGSWLFCDLQEQGFVVSIVRAERLGLDLLAQQSTLRVSTREMNAACRRIVEPNNATTGPEDPPATSLDRQRMLRLVTKLVRTFRETDARSFRCAIIQRGTASEVFISRQMLAQTLRPFVDIAIEGCNRALDSAGLSWDALDKIVLLGDCSEFFVFRDMLSRYSRAGGPEIFERASLFGAAMAAESMARGEAPMIGLAGVTQLPHSIGFRMQEPGSDKQAISTLVKQGTRLPARCSTTVYTSRRDQTRVALQLVKIDADGSQHSLGTLKIGPIKQPKKNLPLEIMLDCYPDGVIAVVVRNGESKERVFRASASTRGFGVEEFVALQEKVMLEHVND